MHKMREKRDWSSVCASFGYACLWVLLR